MKSSNPDRGIVSIVLLSMPILSCSPSPEFRRSDTAFSQHANVDDAVIADDQERSDIVSVHLARTNWEGHGIEMVIDSEARFQIRSLSFQQIEVIRSGSLTEIDQARLKNLIEASDFFDLEVQRQDLPPQLWSVWRYELTITSRERSNRVNFHSEDDAVPRSLHDIVDFLLKSTR